MAPSKRQSTLPHAGPVVKRLKSPKVSDVEPFRPRQTTLNEHFGQQLVQPLEHQPDDDGLRSDDKPQQDPVVILEDEPQQDPVVILDDEPEDTFQPLPHRRQAVVVLDDDSDEDADTSRSATPDAQDGEPDVLHAPLGVHDDPLYISDEDADTSRPATPDTPDLAKLTIRELYDHYQPVSNFEYNAMDDTESAIQLEKLYSAVNAVRPRFEEPTRTHIAAAQEQLRRRQPGYERRTIHHNGRGHRFHAEDVRDEFNQMVADAQRVQPDLEYDRFESPTGTKDDTMVAVMAFPSTQSADRSCGGVDDPSSPTIVTLDTMVGGLHDIFMVDLFPYRQDDVKQPEKLFNGKTLDVFYSYASRNWTTARAKIGLVFGERQFRWYNKYFVDKNKSFAISLCDSELYRTFRHAFVEFGPGNVVTRIVLVSHHPSEFPLFEL